MVSNYYSEYPDSTVFRWFICDGLVMVPFPPIIFLKFLSKINRSYDWEFSERPYFSNIDDAGLR